MPTGGVDSETLVHRIMALDGGLNTLYPPHAIGENESPNVQNHDVSIRGACQTRPGYTRYTASAKSSPTGTFVSGLFAGTLSTGTTFVLATEGSALHDITAGTWATTISGTSFTVDTMVRMMLFNDLFIIANQGGGPWQWTGSGAATSLGGSPPANARQVCLHRSRAFMGNGSSTLFFSALNNPSNWTAADDAGSVVIGVGDGMVINGIASGGDFLVISKISPASGAKEGKIYVMFGSSPFDFLVRKVADFGAVGGQESLLTFDNFVLVASQWGIFGIQGRNKFLQNKKIWPDWIAQTGLLTCAIGRRKNVIKFAFATGSTNDTTYDLNVEYGVWGKCVGKTPRIYATHPDGRLLFGNSGTSIIVYQDENGTNDDGNAINWFVESKDLAWQLPDSIKSPRDVYIHAKKVASTLTVTYTMDGSAVSFVAGNTMNCNTEGPEKRFPVPASRGRFARFRVTDSTLNEVCTLYGIQTHASDLGPQNK